MVAIRRLGGERFASGVNLTRTKTRTIALSLRDAARGSAAGHFIIIVLKKLHRLVPNFVPILLFSYSPFSSLLPSSFGLPLSWFFTHPLVYSLTRTRTVTYRSMAVEIICRSLLTFGDPYIICLYQLSVMTPVGTDAYHTLSLSVFCYNNRRRSH